MKYFMTTAIAAVALAGCTPSDPSLTSFFSEAGSVIDNGDFGNSTMVVGAVKPDTFEMRESATGHPVLSLTDYEDKANFPDQFHEPHLLGRPKRRNLQRRVDGLHDAFVAETRWI